MLFYEALPLARCEPNGGPITPDMQYWEELWDAADQDWREDEPERIPLVPSFCDYLPEKLWSLQMIRHPEVDRLMLLGGQRFGYAYCVTACPSCRACIPARIAVQGFPFSKSQRRTLRRNNDLELRIEPVSYSPEKYQLLVGFVGTKFEDRTKHFRTELERVEYYLRFHLHHPDHTREVQYWDNGQLLGVSIIDVGQQGLYSHYFFYDLSERRRRLGIYSFLREIDMCQQLGFRHLYIGFINEKTAALNYKAQFANLEVLVPELGWVPYNPDERTSGPRNGTSSAHV